MAGDRIKTTAGIFEVVQAGPEHTDTVLSILREAAQWIQAKGIDQWPADGFSREQTAVRVEAGEVYLALRDGEAAGTLQLQRSDPFIWGAMPDDALYVHRLAVRRAFAGQGLGHALLRWAEERAAAAGKTYLRLDCMEENEALNRYYRQAGFSLRRRWEYGKWKANLYEKPLQQSDLCRQQVEYDGRKKR